MKPRWIISRAVDLTLIIGSAAAGWVYLALFVVFQLPVSWLWWVWSVGFDGTHIFATVSRTYCDAVERRTNPWLLWGSAAAFFSLGPLLVLAGWKLVLAIFVGVWAYYHVVRQHYGFLMLYKVKHGDLDAADNRWDTAFLAILLTTPPFLRFFVRSPQELGIPARAALAKLIPGVEAGLLMAVAVFTIAYLIRLTRRPVRNTPKLLLLGAVVPLHWATFHYLSWQAAVPTVTIVHNLQYHAIVWFHNRNKYSGAAGRQYGRVPAAVAHSLGVYLVLGVLFSLVYRVPGFYLGKISDLAFGFFAGFGFTHYYLDSRIWRVRHDPSLAVTLRLRPAAASS